MGAVVYLRVSTEDQKLGPEAQLEDCKRFADSMGLEIDAIHTDHGVSGAAPMEKRDALMDALNDISEGDVLLVSKRDRIARDVMMASTIEHIVSKKGARIVSADGIDCSDDPSARMIRQILDVFAEYELAMIRMRTRAALRAKRRQGKRNGTVPFGFKADADGVLSKDKAEQATVALIYKLRDQGLSLRAISEKLFQKGIVNRRGSKFNATSIKEHYENKAQEIARGDVLTGGQDD